MRKVNMSGVWWPMSAVVELIPKKKYIYVYI